MPPQHFRDKPLADFYVYSFPWNLLYFPTCKHPNMQNIIWFTCFWILYNYTTSSLQLAFVFHPAACFADVFMLTRMLVVQAFVLFFTDAPPLVHHLIVWVFHFSWEEYLQSLQVSLWERMAWDLGVWGSWCMCACVSLGHAQHWQSCRIWTSSTSFLKSMSFQKKLYRFISPSAMTKPLLHILSKTSYFPSFVGTVVANLVALKFASPYLLLCRSFHVFIRHLGFDFFFFPVLGRHCYSSFL